LIIEVIHVPGRRHERDMADHRDGIQIVLASSKPLIAPENVAEASRKYVILLIRIPSEQSPILVVPRKQLDLGFGAENFTLLDCVVKLGTGLVTTATIEAIKPAAVLDDFPCPQPLRQPAAAPISFKELDERKLHRMHGNAKDNADEGQDRKVPEMREGISSPRPLERPMPAPRTGLNKHIGESDQEERRDEADHAEITPDRAAYA